MDEQLEREILQFLAQRRQEKMSLREALTRSKPTPPTIQIAYMVIDDRLRYVVAFDGKFWDLHFRGSPFSFSADPPISGLEELEAFLVEEGIDLHYGWQPHIVKRT